MERTQEVGERIVIEHAEALQIRADPDPRR
jgi:hypothetical protein